MSWKLSVVLFVSTMAGFALPHLAAAADDGAKVFAESCATCHTAKFRPLDNMHLTREQWKVAIDRMLDQGAEVPKGKMGVLLDYLYQTNGPVQPAPNPNR